MVDVLSVGKIQVKSWKDERVEKKINEKQDLKFKENFICVSE